MKIVFVMSVASHQNATFGLAKELVKIGHEVIYAGTEKGIYGEDLNGNVFRQGYSYLELDPYTRLNFESLNISMDKNKEEFVSLAYNLLEGHIFNDFVRSTKPDLVLLDVHFPLYALALAPFDVPVVFLSTELYTGRISNCPPLTSSIIPENTFDSRMEIHNAWRKHGEENAMNPLLRHLIEELSNKSNLAINDLLSEKCIVLFGLKYKELILWAKEFEFRTSSNDSNVIYLGSYVDKERNEMDLGFMNYMDGKPLAYFSIGTVLDDKSLSEFVGRLISAFGLVPEFNFIVSTGRLFDEIKTLMVPENVQIHRYVPQLQVLEKTSLMITMGGANSIKECIELGVPMLCYPFHNDQFGNSARVEFHKLGLRGDFQDPPQEMARKIKDIINNNEYETNILSFRKKAKTRITPSELKELIESLIEK